MCTLSWIFQDAELHIVFSRDESLQRIEAEAPRLYEIAKTAHASPQKVIAPKDPQGQGFWIATNASGLTLCVLNDYGSQGQGAPARSRGLLVRDLSAYESPADISQMLRQPEHQTYAPCFLFVFWHTQSPVMWHWNGRDWVERVAIASPFSTSSWLPTLTPKLRHFLFNQGRVKNQWPCMTPERQLSAHRTRCKGLAWASVAMQRKGRATVSLTRVRVSYGLTRMEYWHGDPTVVSPPVSLDLKTTYQRLPDIQPIAAQRHPPIQIDSMLAAKNPQLLKQLQGVKLHLLEWLTRVHWINQQLMTIPDTSARHFSAQVLNRLGVSARILQHSELPSASERPVFLANHPTGGLDGLLLIAWLQQHYPKVRVIVTDLLNVIPALRPLWIPVDRYQSSREAVRKLHHAFAEDAVLLVFPAGRTARRQKGQLTDFPWHAMPVSLAQRSGRCVVPVHLEACNSWRFYTVAWLRQRLRMVLNIEMALLARELLSPATRQFDIVVGDSVSTPELQQVGINDAERMAWLRAQYERLVNDARNVRT